MAEAQSPFLEDIDQLVFGRGLKFFDAHGHLDREGTLKRKYYEYLDIDPYELTRSPLSVKQYQVGYLHDGPAYCDKDDMYNRMRENLQRRTHYGIGTFYTCIDSTPDIGLSAFDLALQLKTELHEELALKIGAYPLWGFKRPEENPDRLNIFLEASERADFVCGLPERDEAYDRVGFEEHIKIILKRAIERKIPAHFHVDQANDPSESGTERLIEAVKWLGSPEIAGETGPTVWAVHVISPSAYDEERFWKMVEDLVKYNIGVIFCPRAAISMRQLRPIITPTHNCIARVLEMKNARVHVRLGSDNVADAFVPTGNEDLRKDIEVGADVLRFYAPTVWAKIATGIVINENDREIVRRTLLENYEAQRAKARLIQTIKEQKIQPWTLPEY